jgi:lipoate-protein ligase B
MLAVWAGEVIYEEALRWQRLLASARAAGEIDDVLLSLTHDRVYTAGRRADVAANVLGTRDIRVVPTDRGGDVTYHGPGQLVVYPILKLGNSRGVRPYVTALEEAIVRTAASFGVAAAPDRRRPGVWVGDDKLAAIGVRVEHGVTRHGLAFNVSTDLDDFTGLVPCGITDGGVCSLRSLGVDTDVEEVRRRLVAHLGDTLRRPLQPARPADLGLMPAAAGVFH